MDWFCILPELYFKDRVVLMAHDDKIVVASHDNNQDSLIVQQYDLKQIN